MKLGIKHQMIAVCVLLTSISLLECKKEGIEPEPEPEDTIKVVVIEKANYYVATNGSDSNAGTINAPFANLLTAMKLANAGDLIYVRGGTYYLSARLSVPVGKSGTSDNLIRVFAFPGEKPVFTGSGTFKDQYGIQMKNSSYWHFKGIRITGIKQLESGSLTNAFRIDDSNYNIFEEIVADHNGGTGLYIHGNSNGNLVLNTDSHNNYDPYTPGYAGGNADGFAMGYNPNQSAVNTFSGCRSWNNSDDGYDLWRNDGTVVFENSWAFWNGRLPDSTEFAADGSGFKLGKTDTFSDGKVRRILKNNLAFENRKVAFYQNANHHNMLLLNNTSYKNGGAGFYANQFPEENVVHVLKNNLSYLDEVAYKFVPTVQQKNNSWNSATVSSDDFLSVSSVGADGPRDLDGSLPVLNFMKLKSGSDLIDKGVDVGFPYNGKAPDIGAFEFKK